MLPALDFVLSKLRHQQQVLHIRSMLLTLARRVYLTILTCRRRRKLMDREYRQRLLEQIFHILHLRSCIHIRRIQSRKHARLLRHRYLTIMIHRMMFRELQVLVRK